ncbi:ImmA/IrrE family metallo-endopeptidase [Bacillus ndiopicus]|uniref:ImmA/IrrE family metallo-endopeptidase n=1 Tax=Bacillus ndiopicus TaxID=1347368 RepID=UPI0005AAE196|nr:ImmA/IrrE family metallo-endopeptidase [Bacillus ndiopicus]
MYYYTYLEDYINHLYHKLGITTSTLLDFNEIANRLKIKIFCWPDDSQAICFDSQAYIFLKENQSLEKAWQDFAHELCHILLNTGDQFNMPPLFQKYQEFKANNFMYHACVTTFLLEQMQVYDYTPKSVVHVQHLFNEVYELAEKRLIQYTNKNFNSPYWNGKSNH